MPQTTVTTFDQDGNVVEESTIETSEDEAIRSQANTRLRELYAKGWANLTTSEKAEVPKLVVELLGS